VVVDELDDDELVDELAALPPESDPHAAIASTRPIAANAADTVRRACTSSMALLLNPGTGTGGVMPPLSRA
jgi:hypothetical protein